MHYAAVRERRVAGGIFISYRRDDASHVAGRMADALGVRVGRENVFVDVDSVAPGEDFVRKIETTIRASDTFLAVIGSNWLKAPGPDGLRRIDLPGDFIRLEVKSALAAGLRIIPVLVDGAGMPREEDLPEDIRQLVRHNAVFISHATFARDMAALLEQVAPQTRKAPAKLNLLALPLGAGVLLLGMLTVALWPKGAPAAITSSISLAEDPTSSDRTKITQATFTTERSAEGRLSIRVQLAYRDRMREEKLIDGIPFNKVSPLIPTMPRVMVQVTNTTNAPISISELQFEVIRAEPDVSPLPVLREHRNDYQTVVMFNDGWGPVGAPRLTVKAWGLPEEDRELAEKSWKGLASWEPCAQPKDRVDVAPLTVAGEVGGRGASFDLKGHVPRKFDGAAFVCAMGELSYTDRGRTETLAVRTRVANRPPGPDVAAPATNTYDLYLDPDREGYVAVVPAFLEIPAGGAAPVTVRIITDKSSDFQLRQSVRLADGQVIPGEAFDLGIFASPNYQLRWVLNPSRRVPVPIEAIKAVDKDGLVALVTYDANGRESAVFHVLDNLDHDACMAFLKDVAPRILAEAKIKAATMEVDQSVGMGCSTEGL